MERNEWRGPEELKYPTFDEKYPPLEIGYNNLNETINFGKYEGMTFQEIIDIDPSYINFLDDKKLVMLLLMVTYTKNVPKNLIN